MKNFFKKTWGFFSGKKRAIGLLVMGVSKFCGEYEMIVFALGSLIGGTGIAHALKKRSKVMDIKDIKEMMKFVINVTEGLVKTLEDGKFKLTEVVHFISSAQAAPAAFTGMSNIPAEFSDMDAQEQAELIAYVQEEFDIPNDSVEAFVEKAFAVAVSVAALIQEGSELF